MTIVQRGTAAGGLGTGAGAGQGPGWRIAAVVGTALAVAGTGLLLTVEPSTSAALRVDGTDAIWWVSGTRVLFDLSAVAVVGCLLAAAMLRPPDGRSDVSAPGLRRAATGWAVAWCLTTVTHLLAVTSELTGLGVVDLVGSPGLLAYGVGIPRGGRCCWSGSSRSPWPCGPGQYADRAAPWCWPWSRCRAWRRCC